MHSAKFVPTVHLLYYSKRQKTAYLMSSVKKRLQKEYNAIINATNKFHIELKENNIFEWKGTFIGPNGTPYVNGRYIFNICFTNQYPMKAPQITFINPPYCLNVCGHDDYEYTNKNYNFGYISFHKLHNQWSPALKMTQILDELYNFCFYECGNDNNFDVNHPPTDGEIHLNKYKLYQNKPREFLYKISQCNEIYGDGNTCCY
eukprot:515623_1